jgi:hypothetical protein
MSRGPGRLQAKILDELSREPGGRIPWRWLRQRYPHEVRQKSFYRAIRSLRRRRRIIDYKVERSLGGHDRYIAIVPVYEVGGRLRFAYEADRELVTLADQAQRQLRTLAAARGIRLEPRAGTEGPLEGTSVDAYRREEV